MPITRRSLDNVAFFFFQAEDGIRDGRVTGVQTCALPIWVQVPSLAPNGRTARAEALDCWQPFRSRISSPPGACAHTKTRSEERRVGKECSTGGSPDQEKKMLGVGDGT